MKLKTHKTTSKRLRLTGSGILMRSTPSAQHLRHNKTDRQLAEAKTVKVVAKGQAKRFKKLLPYLSK